MLYRKVRISHLDNKKLLYRVLYVPEDIRLSDFAKIIMETFRMEYEHLYEFRKGMTAYTIPNEYDPFGFSDDYGGYDMREHTLHDPGDTYRFIYDYGDDWQFEVRIYKKTQEFPDDLPAIVLEGRGRGIWEDNRWGYLRLLSGEIDGNTAEDDEENEFYLPWNLELEHVKDTFDVIDPDEETGYLDAAVTIGDPDDDFEDTDGVFREFNRLYNKAADAFIFGRGSGENWLKAYESFREACGQLREKGILPSRFTEIEDVCPGFEGAGLVEDLIDELPDYDMFEELWQIMDEMENMFRPDGETEYEIIRGKAEALHGMKRDSEMLSYVQQKYAENPENDTVRMLMLNAFRYNRKKKDGKAFLEEILEKEPECNEDNYSFYFAAAEFANYAGLKSLERKLTDEIDREDAREVAEMEAYDEFDAEDGFMEGSLREELHQKVLEYKQNSSPENFSQMLAAFGALVIAGGMIHVSGEMINPEEGHVQLHVQADEQSGEQYLFGFTKDGNSLPARLPLAEIPAEDAARFVLEVNITGLVLDTDPYDPDDPPAFIGREAIQYIFDVMEKNGLFDDPDGVEPDEDFPDIFDEDDLPF